MDLILTDVNGNDIRTLDFSKADFDLANEKDFEITIPLEWWKNDIIKNCRIYQPNSEVGGLVGEIETDTSTNEIKVRGYTWRGLLSKKIITPPSGEDYYTVNGELNALIKQIVDGRFNGLFKTSDLTTNTNVSYQFERYTDVLNGLLKMLKSKNFKLKFAYIQQERGLPGYIEISAVKIEDFSSKIELSQDSRLNFKITKKENITNHLIVLGDGELKDREVINLYLDDKMNISTVQYYFGIDEIAEVYENTGSEDLQTDGINHFKELIAYSAFEMDIEQLGIDVEIGDIIGGRDYITGLSISKPLANKIVTYGETDSIQYVLEEETE